MPARKPLRHVARLPRPLDRGPNRLDCAARCAVCGSRRSPAAAREHELAGRDRARRPGSARARERLEVGQREPEAVQSPVHGARRYGRRGRRRGSAAEIAAPVVDGRHRAPPRTRRVPISLLSSVRCGRGAGPGAPHVLPAASVRKRWSPLVDELRPVLELTRYAGFAVDQWASTRSPCSGGSRPRARCRRSRRRRRARRVGRVRPSAMRTGVSPWVQ